MECRYCKTFHESESRITYGSGENKITERFCLWARKMVPPGHPICNEFTLSHLFWCRKNNCQQIVHVCTNCQQNPNGLYPECKNCSQGREILDLRRLSGIKRRQVGQISETPFVPPPEILPIEPTRSKIIKRRDA
jgi:hypothetical protein